MSGASQCSRPDFHRHLKYFWLRVPVFVLILTTVVPLTQPALSAAPTVAPSGLGGGGGAPNELIINWTVSQWHSTGRRAAGGQGTANQRCNATVIRNGAKHCA